MSRTRKDIKALALANKKAKDYDPEDENVTSDDDSINESEDEELVLGGREHYQTVGKSKLRRPETKPLDSKYAGVAISAKDLASDSEHDPFASDDNDEDDKDPFAVARIAARSPGSDASMEEEHTSPADDSDETDGSAASDIDKDEMTSADEDMEDFEGDNSDMEQSEDNEQSDEASPAASGARGDLRALLSRDTKELASGLSQAVIADAAKGRAVKRQYQTFDRILDARMKLQKGLSAMEQLKIRDESASFTADAEEALKSAQESARNMFNTISSLRETIKNASTVNDVSKKRKRPVQIENVEDLSKFWETLQKFERDTLPTCKAVINKWSSREKAFESALTAKGSKEKFHNTSTQPDQLSSVLDVYISNEQEKHFRPEDEEGLNDIRQEHGWPEYDDSVFYQSLLRDLIASRSATSAATDNISGALLPHKLHPSGNTQNKKNVDTKASKGRKVRYNVHEKLQNFMAAEGDTGRDTAMWTERGKNEFFGSLFGQDQALVEGDEDPGHEDIEAEVEALRLFRT